MGKIIAIDFDETIHDSSLIPPGHRLGPPMEGAMSALTWFKSHGYDIVIHCVWADDEKNIATIAKWMDYFELPYDDITNIKPAAEWFIDDRNIEFRSWNEVMMRFVHGKHY